MNCTWIPSQSCCAILIFHLHLGEHSLSNFLLLQLVQLGVLMHILHILEAIEKVLPLFDLKWKYSFETFAAFEHIFEFIVYHPVLLQHLFSYLHPFQALQ